MTRLPGMKEICMGQKEKQKARDAISQAKDAALLAKMHPSHRHVADRGPYSPACFLI